MISPSSPKARLLSSVATFARDEEGGATIWNLSWLLGFVIMAGVSIDSTNGWRNKTMLQSTADVAALAGVIEVPSPFSKIPYDPTPGAYDATVKAKALEYADKNQGLGADEYGSYLELPDILIGNWDVETRTFTPGDEFATPDALPVNAVQVDLFQSETNRGNGVPMQVLGTIGWSHWEVATTATAMVGLPECYGNKVIANDEICIRSNNYFYAGQCFHGENGVNFRNNNTWEMQDDQYTIAVSSNGTDNIAADNYENGMGPVQHPGDGPTGLPMELDTMAKAIMGLEAGDINLYLNAGPNPAFPAPSIYTLTGNQVGGNVTAWLDTGIQLASLDGFASIVSLLAASQTTTDGDGGGLDAEKDNDSNPGCNLGSATGTLLPDSEFTGLQDALAAMAPTGSQWEWDPSTTPLTPGNIYFYNGTNKLTINGHLENVAIISTQEITVANGSVIEGSTLFSMDGIQLGQGVTVGKDDGCTEGGGTKLLAMHEIDSAADLGIYGSFFVSGGHIGVAAQSDGIEGFTSRSMGNTTFTSNGAFGPVAEGDPTDVGACPVDFFVHPSELDIALVE